MIRIVRDYRGDPLHEHGCVACIGAFDGVHLGHQRLLARVAESARRRALPMAVVSFDPLPREFFGRETAPPRLMNLHDRACALAGLGVDTLWLLRFNQALASVSAENFVRDGLVARLGVRSLHVGAGFRFGHRRVGDVGLLRQMGEQQGFDLSVLEPVQVAGERASSTRIREALADGDLDLAGELLGRPYSMSGRVFRGQQLGRTLGFPTANLLPGRCRALRDGIYAVSARLKDGRVLAAVASLGKRPTVAGQQRWLEVHLFDFDGDLYGQRLSVQFHRFLRAELKFDDLDAMVAQMHRDAAQARAIMSSETDLSKTDSQSHFLNESRPARRE